MPWLLAGRETDERFRCTQTARVTGKRCRCPAAWGTDVCRFHGGTGWSEQLELGRRELEDHLVEHLRWLGYEV